MLVNFPQRLWERALQPISIQIKKRNQNSLLPYILYFDCLIDSFLFVILFILCLHAHEKSYLLSETTKRFIFLLYWALLKDKHVNLWLYTTYRER